MASNIFMPIWLRFNHCETRAIPYTYDKPEHLNGHSRLNPSSAGEDRVDTTVFEKFRLSYTMSKCFKLTCVNYVDQYVISK